jgi:hypothetical protein
VTVAERDQVADALAAFADQPARADLEQLLALLGDGWTDDLGIRVTEGTTSPTVQLGGMLAGDYDALMGALVELVPELAQQLAPGVKEAAASLAWAAAQAGELAASLRPQAAAAARVARDLAKVAAAPAMPEMLFKRVTATPAATETGGLRAQATQLRRQARDLGAVDPEQERRLLAEAFQIEQQAAETERPAGRR